MRNAGTISAGGLSGDVEYPGGVWEFKEVVDLGYYQKAAQP